MNRPFVVSDRFFAHRNRLGAWMVNLLGRLQSAQLRLGRRKMTARSDRKNIMTRRGRKSHLAAILGVITLTLLGSVLGYLILVFHQD